MPIPVPAQDPSLGSFHVALSGAAVGELFDRHLLRPRSGTLRVESCRPCYARYQPGVSLAIRYELTLRDGQATTSTPATASMVLLAGRRAADLWADSRNSLAPEEMLRHREGTVPGCAAYVPELGGILQLYPVDLQLHGLAHAASARDVQAAVRDVLGDGGVAPLDEYHLTLVRYRPAYKALLRFGPASNDGPAFYLKVKKSRRNAQVFRLNRALASAGVATPTPLCYVHELGTFIHAEAPGLPLASLAATPQYASWMRPAVEALTQLHATRVTELPVPTPGKDGETIVTAARLVSRLLPDLEAEVHQVAAALLAELRGAVAPPVTVHGDFYDDQVIVSPAGVMLLDLEATRLGHPLLDVGNFLAHLSIFPEECAGIGDRARSEFLAAYEAHDPSGLDQAPLFEAAALLPLVVNPFRRLDPAWPVLLERNLRLVQKRLGEYLRQAR